MTVIYKRVISYSWNQHPVTSDLLQIILTFLVEWWVSAVGASSLTLLVAIFYIYT